MTPRTAPLCALVLTAALAALTGGCATASSSTSPAPTSGSATPTASYSIFITLSAGPVVVPGLATPGAGTPVYLAEDGAVTGKALIAPGCAAGCQLSGDGTTSLWDMTWPTWNTVRAVGNGTEKIDDCDPNCAAGTLHAVKVMVTLSKPVLVCVPGTGRMFWTQATFTWPDGLPSALTGDNAPANPFTYPDITSRAAKSCP